MATHTDKYFKSESLENVNFTEPIINSGKSYGIKLLSVYDFMRCEIACKNLINKLVEQGMDKKLCEIICERACIVAMCLYDINNERMFYDGLSVLRGLTPHELKKVYHEYKLLNKKVLHLAKLTSSIVDKIKKSHYDTYVNKK